MLWECITGDLTEPGVVGCQGRLAQGSDTRTPEGWEGVGQAHRRKSFQVEGAACGEL